MCGSFLVSLTSKGKLHIYLHLKSQIISSHLCVLKKLKDTCNKQGCLKEGDQVVSLALIKGYNELVSKIHIRHFSFSDSICPLSSLHVSQNCTMAHWCSRILVNSADFYHICPKVLWKQNIKTIVSEVVLHLCLNRGPLSFTCFRANAWPSAQPTYSPARVPDRGLPLRDSRS